MNIFIISLIGMAIIIALVFGIFMSGERPLLQIIKPESYSVKITGLDDTYHIGEPYSFSYMISGYGSPCGGITITFPINKTASLTTGSIPACLKTNPTDFIMDAKKTYGTTYGHIVLPQGNYTVRVEFEKGPTIAEKSFLVINSTDNRE